MAWPDLLVTTSSICDVRLKWFEDMAQRLDVPLFTLDRPERVFDGTISCPKAYEIRYYRSQLEDLLSFVTEVTGHKYDPGRLNQSLDWGYKTNELRLEILELRKIIPSPMGSADGFGTMYPGMYCSGTEKAYNFYRALRDEVKAKVKAGQGQIENERFRLLWWGIPLWFNMGIFNYFESLGGVFAYEPLYNPVPWPPPEPGRPPQRNRGPHSISRIFSRNPYQMAGRSGQRIQLRRSGPGLTVHLPPLVPAGPGDSAGLGNETRHPLGSNRV